MDAATASTTRTGRFWSWPRRSAWALLVCWVGALVAIVHLGERSSSRATLESHAASGSSSSDILGWEVTGWLAVAPFALWFLSMVMLALSHTTWRATRWAWFWLCLMPPVGPVGYLVLGGPTGIGGKPSDGAKRLTGGWAFLIMVLVGGAFSAQVR